MTNVEYHRVLAGERRRVGRGILAIVLLLGGLLIFSVVLSVGAAVLDDAGAATAATLIPSAVVVASVAVVWYTTRRFGPVTAEAGVNSRALFQERNRVETHILRRR